MSFSPIFTKLDRKEDDYLKNLNASSCFLRNTSLWLDFISDKYNDIKVELYSLNLCYRFSFLRSEMAVVEYCSGEIFLGTI